MTGKATLAISATVIFLFAAWVGISVITFTKTAEDDLAALPLEEGIVSYVIDGDTIILSDDDTRVRLIGIDAPELGEPLYAESRAFLEKLVGGRVVFIQRDQTDTDPYNRLLRYIYVGTTLVNEEMVRGGLARGAIIPPDTRYAARILSAESSAKREHLGIWAEQ
ncbi:MAG: thermonuclease family protein [Patescibacteria group bacterium]